MKKLLLFHVIFLLGIHGFGQTTLSTNSQTVCAGSNVNVTANNLDPSYTFAWTAPGQTTVNGTQLILNSTSQSITWTCTTYDAMNAFVETDVFTLTVNSLPTVSGGSNQTVCSGTAVTLSGSGAASYSWNNGVTNAVAFTPNATTTYTVTGTDVNGCTNTAQTTVTVNALPTVSAGSNQTVCSGSAVTLSGLGASTYAWSNNVQDGVAFTPASTQTYTVTGTGANGCTNTAQVQVSVNALPTVSAGNNQTVCAGTSVTLTGSGASTYAWNNGVSNGIAFTSAATQTYTVTGTDVNGCINTAQVQVTVNALPTVSAGINQTVCAGTAVTLSASGATSYTWNNGVINGVSFTPNNTQTYTVTGTDGNGCINTAQVQVTVNALPTMSAGPNQTVCAGTSVALSGSGASSYAWNNGVSNGVSFTPASTQTYTVIGTDANGCTNTAQTTVTVNALPTVSGGSNQTVCGGTSVILTGSGASTYAWNNNVQDGVAFTPASTQTYTVTGTGANGCTNTAQVQVSVNALPTVSAGNNQTVCAGTSVTLTGSGASTYAWNNGVSNGIAFTSAATQTYTVTGTDVNGCINTAQVQVTVNALPTVSAGINQTVCAGTAVTLSASGATSYTWNNGVINGVSFTPNNTQTYTVTGTDGNGCINTAQVQVTVNALPTMSAGPNQTVCAGTSVALSGSGASSYAWNNGVSNGVSFTPASTQTYTVIGTDANGCTNTAQTTVTVNALPTVSGGSNQTVCGGTSVILTGSGASTYAWNNNVQDGVAFTPASTQTYTVTGTDAIGCANTAQLTVTVNPLPDSTISTNGPTVFCSGGNVVLSVPIENNSTYSWFLDGVIIPGGVGNSYLSNVSGVFSVIIDNAFNCSSDDSIIITVNPNPATPVIVGAESLCLNSLNQVYTSSPNNNWLIWNINGANIYSGQHTNQVHLDVTSEDTVWIELTAHDLATGCYAIGSLMVLVDTSAVAPPYVNVFPLGNDNDLLCAPQATNVIRWGKINKLTNIIYLEPSVLTYHNFVTLDTVTYYYFVDHGGDGCYTRSYYNYPDLVTQVQEMPDVDFWLAPNPVVTELRIMSESQIGTSISIENLEGKCVYQGAYWTNTPINCANFVPGMYFVKIQTGQMDYVVKFLKL